jgi:uncharacterized damage-inducible protein DinB
MTKWVPQGQLLPFLSSAGDGNGAGGGGGETVWHTPLDSESRPIDEILESLSGLIPALTRLIAGKSREALTQPDNDGFWGVVDVISHLLDWERVNHDRIHRMLREDYPSLTDFDDSLWSVEHNYRDNVPEDVLEELREHREAVVEELQGLQPEEWERSGDLEGRGEISLRWLMNTVCNHDNKHLEQARAILA